MPQKLQIEEMNRLDVAAFKAAEKLPLIVVLDNVRSVHNVGSIFRTADAFRLAGVDWRYFATTDEAIATLKREGYVVASVEQCHRSTLLTDFQLDDTQRYALVMGHEVHGVAQEVVDASDLVIGIPQMGTKHSMNVSVAAGVVMWEFVRQWRALGH